MEKLEYNATATPGVVEITGSTQISQNILVPPSKEPKLTARPLRGAAALLAPPRRLQDASAQPLADQGRPRRKGKGLSGLQMLAIPGAAPTVDDDDPWYLRPLPRTPAQPLCDVPPGDEGGDSDSDDVAQEWFDNNIGDCGPPSIAIAVVLSIYIYIYIVAVRTVTILFPTIALCVVIASCAVPAM